MTGSRGGFLYLDMEASSADVPQAGAGLRHASLDRPQHSTYCFCPSGAFAGGRGAEWPEWRMVTQTASPGGHSGGARSQQQPMQLLAPLIGLLKQEIYTLVSLVAVDSRCCSTAQSAGPDCRCRAAFLAFCPACAQIYEPQVMDFVCLSPPACTAEHARFATKVPHNSDVSLRVGLSGLLCQRTSCNSASAIT